MAVRSRTRCLLLASSDGDLDRRLRSALDAVPDVEVIGIPDPPTLLATVAQGSCGLVLLGPALDSPEILAPLRALDPIVPVLVVSPVEDPYAIVAAMRAGASDYLLSRDLARLPDLVSRHLRGDGDPVPGTGPREATARLRARLGDLRRAMREGDRSADLCGQTLEELQAAADGFGASQEELTAHVDALEHSQRLLAEALEAVRPERERYEALFQGAPDAYLVTDAEGAILETNRAARALLGLPADGDPRRTLEAFMASPGEVQRFREALGALRARGGLPERFDLYLRPLDRQETVITSATVEVEPGATGGVRTLRWILRDITARREAQEALRASEARLRAVLDVLPVAVFIADADGRLLIANPAVERIWGRAPLSERVAEYAVDYPAWWPDGRRVRGEEWGMARALATGEVVEAEQMEILGGDGARRTILSYARPIRDAVGAIAGGVSVNVDITDRARVEEQHASVARFPEENPQPVLRVAADGTLLYGNRAGAGLLAVWGVRAGGALPEPWAGAVAQALAEGAMRRVEATAGETHYVLLVVPIAEQGYANIYAADITERRRVEQALRESQQRLAEELEVDRRLHEVSTQLIQADDIEALYEQILDTAVGILHVDFASLQMLDRRGGGAGRLHLLGHRGFTARAAAFWEWVTASSESTCGEALRTGQRVIVADLERGAPRFGGDDLAVCLEVGIRAVQTTPLVSRSGALLGAISTHWRRPHTPTEGELRAIDVLARQAADLIEYRMRDAELQRRVQDLAALYDASQALQGELDEGGILRRVCDVAVERFGLRMAWVGLAQDGALRLVAAAGEHTDYADDVRTRVDDPSGTHPPSLRALESGAAVRIADARTDPTIAAGWRERLLACGFLSLAAVPLRGSEEILGVLAVYAGEPDALDEPHVQTLQSLANLAGAGLEKARLHATVQRHATTLEARVIERTAQLRASEERFRAMFQDAAVGIALLDPEGRILQANAALSRLLGVEAPTLVGEPLARFTAKEDAGPQVFGGLAERPTTSAVRYRRADGEPRWGRLTLSAARDGAGAVQFVIAMLEDVTDEREAQQALLRAEKLSTTGQLAAAFAHEVKNPLQAVLGVLTLAAEANRALDTETTERYLDVAREELQRADRILTRLRDLHRRADQEAPTPLDLGRLLEQVLLVVERRTVDQGVEVVRSWAADLPPVMGLSDELQQVFLNLVLNALDAMPEGGRLDVVARPAEQAGRVSVEVRDTGRGIPGDVLPRVFEFLYSTKASGTGLGLFVSRSIVRRHGGDIAVASEEGAGTTFSVWLPAAKTP